MAYFKMVPFPLFIMEAQRGFFSVIYCQDLVELLEVKLTKVCRPICDWVPLEFLTLRFVHTKPPVISHLQSKFSCPGTDSSGHFCSWASAPGYQILCICFSFFPIGGGGGNSLFCDLTSLMDIRRIVYFPIGSACYLL